MLTRVYSIRHGETAWNALGRWQGHAPVPLNETGMNQAQQLARWLAQSDERIDVIYSSDLKRAMQTAQAVGDALGLSILPERRLREVDLGEWQGLNHSEAEAWDTDRYAAFKADWYNVPTPSGESRNELKARVRAAFDEITARHAGQHVALVTHGGTLGMLIESLFGKIERPTLTNTSLTVMEQTAANDPWQLVNIAWSPHLSESPLGETW
ncbi:MAG TPA: histidine phosphatase family protein [Aggregatilinea sp.]|jgi:probable phosphoglycerate mutase|uniref:histidine phosphatase family protein n=1 Tax=Aggregatilinea sp. TaxID=2806333 RepID=UPI002B9928FB|nr:histidine phosphatase family protein [Aggregatilinea sp.]HML23021.1 histidine phosphatase family protein [Aggregatilinea sp.]